MSEYVNVTDWKMRLDTDRPITRDASSEHVRSAIAEISSHQQHRREQLHWASNLRYLTADLYAESDEDAEDSGSDNAPNDSTDTTCNCDGANVRDFSPNDRCLRLTLAAEIPECCHYVAVSYCWASIGRAQYNSTPFTITDSDRVPRSPICPQTLLDKAVQYASWKQQPFIWIDQECIDQTDVAQKNVGIQSMDLVYQQSAWSLAILETNFSEQRHLDALAELLENNVGLVDPQIIRNICEALTILMSEPWFERAWCLQESVSGNRTMTLLLNCGKELDVPLTLKSELDGCFELDLRVLHQTIISSLGVHLERLAKVLGPDALREHQRVVDQWYDTMAPDVSNEFDTDARTVCNASQALSYLSRRQNSVVADRLAIMANLCRYDIRLDAWALDAKGFSFSICAYVLAVLNGDFSIDMGHCDWKRTGNVGRSNRLLEPSTHIQCADGQLSYSWFLAQHGTLDKLSYYDHDANPLRSMVLPGTITNGIRLRGCAWIADRTLDLSQLASKFAERHEPRVFESIVRADPAVVQSKDESDESERARIQLLISLLCWLAKHDFSGMLRLIWEYKRLHFPAAQQNADANVALYSKSPFDAIVDIDSETVKWASPTHYYVIRYTQPLGPFGPLTSKPMKFLLRRIIERGSLVVARPMSAPAEPESYTAFFDADVDACLFFTPKANGTLGPAKEYDWFPYNWLLSKYEAGEEDTATCQGSVVGLWSGNESFEQTILLQ